MGVIYNATDLYNGLDCIIKEIIVSQEEENFYINSFFREKELLSKLYHPGIVNLLDFFQEHNSFYLVLEYIDGISSDEFIEKNYKKNKIPLNKILYWSLQICDILAYLHSMSPPVIYRDLKPENILIDRKERIKLIDFGIARTYKEGK
jgi:serine/threonine-protein kinase